MERTIDECFFQIQNGANIKQGDVDGGYPITRIETTANDKFNRDRMGYAGITDLSKYESYVLEDGDLLMSHINSVQYLGRTVLYEKQGGESIIHGMNLLRLKARRDIINPAYARYCFYGHPFRSQVANITKKSVNQASFAVKDLKKIKIDVPEVERQNQIVEILNKTNELIEKRQQELDTLDELIKARFVELFGNGHDGVCKTERLGDFCKFQQGTQVPVEDQIEEKKEGYTRFLRIVDYTQAPQEPRYVSVKGREITEDSVVIVRYGATAGFVGHGYSGILANNLFEVVPDEAVLSKDFLYLALKYGTFEKEVHDKAFGAAMPALSFGMMNDIGVVTPDPSEQSGFVGFVKQVDKSKVV